MWLSLSEKKDKRKGYSREEKEQIKKDIIEAKNRYEQYYVVCLYNKPELYFDYGVDDKHFDSKANRFLYLLAENMIKKGYETLDIISVDTFVQTQGQQAQKMYEGVYGYKFIDEVSDLISVDNIAQYHGELLKYSSVLKLMKQGFAVINYWDEVKDLTYRELSDFVTEKYSEIFTNAELGKDEVVDIKSGVREMVERADKGALEGIPYTSKLLSAYTMGMRRGEMVILAAKSGQGKSFLATNLIVPSMIKIKQRLLIICNEEDMDKWQREILVQIINNTLVKKPEYKGQSFNKKRFFKGRFSEIEKKMLNDAIEIMEKSIKDGYIMFVNLTTFSMDKSIEIVKKYTSKYNINYYILDTLKLDNDVQAGKAGENSWLALQQASVKLFNTIKAQNRNAHILLTYQLNKQNVKRLSMESLGMSKNIVDVASTVILARNMTEDEKTGDKSLEVVNAEGSKVVLQQEKDYMILFIDKNRAGETGKEIVLETDKARNIIRDCGLTYVPYSDY